MLHFEIDAVVVPPEIEVTLPFTPLPLAPANQAPSYPVVLLAVDHSAGVAGVSIAFASYRGSGWIVAGDRLQIGDTISDLASDYFVIGIAHFINGTEVVSISTSPALPDLVAGQPLVFSFDGDHTVSD